MPAARRECSDLLTAFELILRGGIEMAIAHGQACADPLAALIAVAMC